MNSIQSKIIGTLNQNAKFEDWWESEEIAIPFFNGEKLKIIFMDLIPENDKDFLPQADLALQNFFNKDESFRISASEAVYKNCIDISLPGFYQG